ncbi:hypothetical protein [Micromonospora chokoriensis]|uniref:hypothetical protein n=1 Tax=Micromonospora chokoriensis TaxID=356851 RepID=UPI0004C3F1D4|nr:hypothetical protein [Micromonospora chokoriensis]
MSSTSVNPLPPALIVEHVGETLTLCTAVDPRTSILRLAAALPAQQGRRAVLSSPSVTARQDLFDQLVEALTEHLGGVATGVRLVPLGSYAPAVDPGREVQLLAEWIGQEVTYPQSKLMVSAGTVLQPVAWKTVDPEGGVRSEPLWPDVPSPAGAPLSPAVAPTPVVVPASPPSWPPHPTPQVNPAPAVAAAPALVAAPAPLSPSPVVAAPAPLSPSPVVVAPPPSWPPLPQVVEQRAERGDDPSLLSVTPHWPHVVLHTNGGFVDLPARRPPRVLWPARPTPRVRHSSPMTVPATMPGVRTAAGWSFLGQTALGDGRILAGFVVEILVKVTGFRLNDRPVPPRALAKLIEACRAGDSRPLVLVTSGVPVRGAAADLLFGGLADALTAPLYVADGAVTRTATGLLWTSGSFTLWGRRQPGAARGPRPVRAVGPVLPPRPSARKRRPGPSPAQPTAAAPVAVPAPIAPKIVALLKSARWMAHARWPALLVPPAEDAVLTGDTGPTRISDAASAAEVMPTAVGLDQPDELMVSVLGWQPEMSLDAVAVHSTLAAPPSADTASTLSSQWEGPAGDTSVAEHAPLPETPSGPPPRWLVDVDGQEVVANPAALRQALDGRYDAHARVVARTLAQSPGLRAAAGASRELAAGLVAVRAYCAGERALVNQVLRGGGPDSELDRLLLVARSAGYGLRRLPSVLGPVFQHGLVDPGLAAAYRPGDVLVEPAFVDVDLAPRTGAEEGVRFAIWSVSARRLDGLDTGARAAAIFPPGSRFQVLAVDEATPDRAARVLLRDLMSSHRGGHDGSERILDRLRTADQGGKSAADDRVPLPFAPGLDDAGRPFPAPALAGAAVTADEDVRA